MGFKAGGRRVLDTAMYAFGLMLVLNLTLLLLKLDHLAFRILAGALVVVWAAAVMRVVIVEKRRS